MNRVVVMGVSGTGKSTVGRALAEALGVPFADGDSFHSAAPGARFVHLLADATVVASRMEARREREGHFMPRWLLASQYADPEPLAPDEGGLSIDVSALSAAFAVERALKG